MSENNSDQDVPRVSVPFTKYFLLAGMFFVLTPVALFVSVFSLLTISSVDQEARVLAANTENTIPVGVNIFASLPNDIASIDSQVIAGDAREEIIRQYLARYESPLTPYANEIVKAADAYDIDFRLITAIAQQESNLCKKIPPETYNCWGWGIHSRGTLGFSSFKEGIYTVSRGLRKDYYDKGYTNPDDIMTKYTPMSNGSWANGVNTFMLEME